MATTTPNFGWAVPTSSDLVKNGAVAIETLGDAIDASLVDLKGGTTGQVLSKASGTDMDFTWTAAGASSPLTTKGDLYTYSTTNARLGVGTNGQVLTADSSAATGIKWATPAGGGGKVLQVVQATTTTGLNTSATTYQNTSLSASITPSATSSKVLVIAMQVATIQASDRRSIHTLFRGDASGTDLSSGTTDGLATASNQSGGSSNYPFSMQYLDSPSTTSSQTYTAAMKTDGGGQCGVRANTMQVMILMEIGA